METIEKQTLVTGKEGKAISVSVATEWTRNYRDRNPGATVSHHFGHEIIEQIISQNDCVGLRMYYANDAGLTGWQKFMYGIGNFFIKASGDAGRKHIILTGVGCDGADQLPANGVVAQGDSMFSANGGGGDSTVGDQSQPCPGSPGCPNNALTGGK